MEKYIKEYLKSIESSLDSQDTDYNQLLIWHEKHIGFFQHERTIHLLVTILFSILTILSIGADVFAFSPAIFILSLIFLIMTCAYIKHYYFLENSVQKMYHIYDEIYNFQMKGGKIDENL